MGARSLLRMAGALAALALAAACTGNTAPPNETLPAGAAPAPTIQPDDVVDLTLYFRVGSGPAAYLAPVTREVPVSEDLPRTVVELLLAGPTDADGDELMAPLPTTTQLLWLAVEGSTAKVDLSSHVVTDAEQVGATPEDEFLALAALADTLTEFPAIEQVHLTVAGAARHEFWGNWGVPEFLVRDESVVGPGAREGDGVPDLSRFGTDGQAVGPDAPQPLAVTSVRLRERASYLQLAVQVGDSADTNAPAPAPRARARLLGDELLLEIDEVTSYQAEVVAGQQFADGTVLESIGVELTELPGTVRISLALAEPRPFHLLILTSPTRVVLDVKK